MSDSFELLERTKSLYYPDRANPYSEVYTEISAYMDQFMPLVQGCKVLDFGAGERPWKPLWDLGKLDVTYADVTQNSTGSIDAIIDGNTTLPFGDRTYDCVFLMDVLEHIRNDIVCLKELARITKPQGYLVLNVPFMYRFHEIPHDYRRYTPTALRALLEDSGYNVLRIQPTGSDFMVCRTMLNESRGSNGLVTRIIKKIVIGLLDGLKRYSERSELAAFSYFVIAQRT